LDAAKAEDVRALGEIACFVGSKGTRTSAKNLTSRSMSAFQVEWRSVALEFIRAATNSDPSLRPDSDVIIFHPFLFLSCQEVRHRFVEFLCSNAHSDLVAQISEQMGNWSEKIPEDVKRLADDEDIDDLREFIGKIVEAKLTDYMELMKFVTAATRAAPHLFSYFIWEFLKGKIEKVNHFWK
jgi:hypothetical protein